MVLKKPVISTTIILTLIWSFAISHHSYAQKECVYDLKGCILDIDSKTPLPFVQIKLEHSNKVTQTDLDGEFHFSNLCDTNQVLIISCFGYCDTTCASYHQYEKSPHILLRKEVYSLDEVIITVEKKKDEGTVSIAQEIIEQKEITTDRTQTLAKVLEELDGVNIVATGTNVQLPVIHGLYGNRILILNNGFKHGFQNWGTEHAPEIDINAANNISVVKGAANVKYGPEALGGAIIVNSDPMYLNEPFKVSISSGYQTNGKGYYSNASLAQGGKLLSYHLGANYTRIGDRHAPDYFLTNTGKQELGINGGLRFNYKKIDFKTYYSFFDQNLGILRASVAESGPSFTRALAADEPLFVRSFSYDINEPNQFAQHHLAKIEMDWWFTEDSKLTFRYGKQLNKRTEYDVRRDAYLPILNLELNTSDYQVEWKHPDWAKLDGIVGFQAFSQNNDNIPGTGTTPFIPNYNTQRYSGFFVESISKDKNTIEFGLRLDHEYNDIRGRETNQDIYRDNYTFKNMTASLGLIKQLNEGVTFRSNIGSAWRTPNMSELYSFGQHGYKITYGLLRYNINEDGNYQTNSVLPLSQSNIASEKGFKLTNELRAEKQKNEFVTTLYMHYIQNFIFERPIAVTGTVRGPMPAFIYDQANAFFIGTDFTWRRKWSTSLMGTFGLSCLWSHNIEDDEPLINQPPITTQYKLKWTTKNFLNLKKSELFIKPSYTFKQYNAPRTVTPAELINKEEIITPQSEIFDFKSTPDGYLLIDLGWEFKWKHLSGSVVIRNILNTSYRNYLDEMRYFADQMGTNVLLSITYQFVTK